MLTEQLRLVRAPLKAVAIDLWNSSRVSLLTAAIAVLISNISLVLAPYIFATMIDRMSVGNFDIGRALLTGAAYALTSGVAIISSEIVQYVSLILGETVTMISANLFFQRILKKVPNFFIEHNPAEIQNIQARAQQALNSMLQLVFLIFLPGMLQVALTIFMLSAKIDFQIALIVVGYGLTYILVTYVANNTTRPFLEAAITSSEKSASFVGNVVHMMETLRHLGADVWIASRFSALSSDIFESWKKFCERRIFYGWFFGLATAFQIAITFILLIPRLHEGTVTIGDIVLINALLLQLNKPFEMIGGAVDDVIKAYFNFSPMAQMWNSPEETNARWSQQRVVDQARIAFDDVGFRFESGRGISGVSFTASPGRICFIRGPSGSGKTTLLRLLLKSLEPQDGMITVDGVDLRQIPRELWYETVGVVPQDVILMNDTILANIVLGREYDEKKLSRVFTMAALTDLLARMPEGAHTVVGERGLKLSGGERQRVAIARALYGDPKIIVLDEASSALDDETEQSIMNNVRSLADKLTVIAVTHRATTVNDELDNIVQLPSE